MLDKPTIAIAGAGRLGHALGHRLRLAGYRVFAIDLAQSADIAARPADTALESVGIDDALSLADVVALTVPWSAAAEVIDRVGGAKGKILWDCTNPMLDDFGGLLLGTTTSAGEAIAAMAPDAVVVKAVPPFAELLASSEPQIDGLPASCLVCSDDERAKTIVSGILSDLPAVPIDAGPLSAARLVEPAMLMLVRLAYLESWGPRISLDIRTDRRGGQRDNSRVNFE